MKEIEKKKEFARLILKGYEPFKAALQLFPNDTKEAFHVSHEWSIDSEVVSEINRLTNDENNTSFLPTKAEFLQRLWDKMEYAWKPDDYAKLAKVYADCRGFIETKSSVTANVTNTHNVLLIPTSNTDEEWRMKAKQQQQALRNQSVN